MLRASRDGAVVAIRTCTADNGVDQERKDGGMLESQGQMQRCKARNKMLTATMSRFHEKGTRSCACLASLLCGSRSNFQGSDC